MRSKIRQSLTNTMGTVNVLEQYVLSDPCLVVHFVQPGVHRAATPRGVRQVTRHAQLNKARAAEQMYSYIRVAKRILGSLRTVTMGQLFHHFNF